VANSGFYHIHLSINMLVGRYRWFDIGGSIQVVRRVYSIEMVLCRWCDIGGSCVRERARAGVKQGRQIHRKEREKSIQVVQTLDSCELAQKKTINSGSFAENDLQLNAYVQYK